MAAPHQAILYCDGAARGNPGPGSYGFAILDGDTPLIKQGAKIGSVTNNVAEYEGLIQGLKKCLELGVKRVVVRSDSQLLVRQMLGEYKIKALHLKEMVQTAQQLVSRFEKVSFEHIPREQNKLADKLANEALDS